MRSFCLTDSDSFRKDDGFQDSLFHPTTPAVSHFSRARLVAHFQRFNLPAFLIFPSTPVKDLTN
jgi:hypothetical protein